MQTFILFCINIVQQTMVDSYCINLHWTNWRSIQLFSVVDILPVSLIHCLASDETIVELWSMVSMGFMAILIQAETITQVGLLHCTIVFQPCLTYWNWRQIYIMASSNGNIFRVTGPLCGDFTGDEWIPLTKASDAELWCFLWSAPEQGIE